MDNRRLSSFRYRRKTSPTYRSPFPHPIRVRIVVASSGRLSRQLSCGACGKWSDVPVMGLDSFACSPGCAPIVRRYREKVRLGAINR